MSNKKNRNKEKKAAKIEARTRVMTNSISDRSLQEHTNDGSSPWIQMVPLAFFTAFIIMIVRLHNYTRNMDQFFWSNESTNTISDLYSYCKAMAILFCACLVILIIVFRLINKSWKFEISHVYIPVGIVMLMTAISYFASDYKEFSLLGFNDRFEGTLVWLAYMVVLVYALNIVKSEYNVKWVIYPVAASSVLLGLMGVLQATNHNPLKYPAIQKLIFPNIVAPNDSGLTYHQLIDYASQNGDSILSFTFDDGQISQTVYNINYVSFYLTLLLPLFAMLFIRSVLCGKEEKLYKKIIWLGCFALAFYNFIGSSSSSGLIGLAVSGLLAIILLNKRILKWWKPVAGVLATCVIIMALTTSIWLPEWGNTIKSGLTLPEEVDGAQAYDDNAGDVSGDDAVISEDSQTSEGSAPESSHVLKNIITGNDSVEIDLDDLALTIKFSKDDPFDISVTDSENKKIELNDLTGAGIYDFNDDRLSDCILGVVPDSDTGCYNYGFTADSSKTIWMFRMTDDGVKYINSLNKETDMSEIPAIGFENNQKFGSRRGYIWSRTLPIIKSTIFIGKGADTFCIYFPQNDYVGKYNAGFFDGITDMIIDKPHNMYMNMAVGTGLISMLAFIAIILIYAVQSIRLYRKREYKSFTDYVGMGIFLGVMGFAATGLVNDSTVSVMPLFFGLMGTGMAINIMLKKACSKQAEDVAGK